MNPLTEKQEFKDIYQEKVQRSSPKITEFSGTNLLTDNDISTAALFEYTKDERVRKKEIARVKNAAMFAEWLNIEPQRAYQLEPEILKRLYPTEKVESDNFLDKIKVIIDYNVRQNKIGMMTYEQITGRNSPWLEKQIILEKAAQPTHTEMEEITSKLSGDLNILDRIAETVKSVPFMAAEQLPMINSAVARGIPAALTGAAGAAAVGTVAAPGIGTGVGYVGGFTAGMSSGMGSYMYELSAGLAAYEMKETAKRENVQLDENSINIASHLTGVFIASFEMLGLGVQASAFLKTKAVSETVESITKHAINGKLKAAAKIAAVKTLEIGKAAAFEGLTEGIEEIAEDIFKNSVYEYNKLIDGTGIDSKPTIQILKDAGVVASMTIPLAMVTGGLGSLATAGARSINFNSAKRAEKIIRNFESITTNMENIKQKEHVSIHNIKKVNKKNAAEVEYAVAQAGKIVRPRGLYAVQKRVDIRTNTYDVTIDLKNEENNEMSFQSKDGKHSGIIRQADTGIEVIFDKSQDDVMNVRENVERTGIKDQINRVVFEGNDYQNLEISDSAMHHIENITDFMQEVDNTALSKLDKVGITEIMLELSKELDMYQEGSRGHNAILQAIYNYSSMNDLYSSLDATTIEAKIKAEVFDIDVTPQIRAKLNDRLAKRGVRLNFTKQEARILAMLKETKTYQSNKDLFVEAKSYKLKHVKNTSPSVLANLLGEITELKSKTKGLLRQRGLGTTEIINNSVKELEIEAESVKQASSNPQTIQNGIKLKKVKDTAKYAVLYGQMQYHHMAAYLAGEQSTIFNTIYREPVKAQRRISAKVTEVWATFFDGVFQNGVTRKDLKRWSSTSYEIDGKKIPAGQALALFMHMKCEKNNSALRHKGFSQQDLKGRDQTTYTKHMAAEINAAFSQDVIGVQIADSMARVYEELQALSKHTYESLTGNKFQSVPNYFPLETLETIYMDADDAITKRDEKSAYMTHATGSLVSRTEEISEIVLRDAFEVLNRSITREIRYALGEASLLTASRVMFDPKIKTAIKNVKSDKYYDYLLKHLEQHAGKITKHEGFNGAIMWANSAKVKAGVWYNPWVALQAPGSFALGGVYVQPSYMFKAFTMAAKHPKVLIEMMTEKMPAIQERRRKGNTSSVQDMMETTEAKRIAGGSINIENIGYAPITALDLVATSAVGYAAYLQAIDEFQSGELSTHVKNATGLTNVDTDASIEYIEAAAIHFAEDVIAKTQPAVYGMNKNLMQKGSASERSLASFGGFTNLRTNLSVTVMEALKRDGKAALPMAATFLGMFAITAAGAAGIGLLKDWVLKRDTEERRAWKIVLDNILGDPYIIRDIYGIWKSQEQYGAYAGGRDGILAIYRLAKTYVSAFQYLIEGSGIVGKKMNEHKIKQGVKYLTEAVSKTGWIPGSMRDIGTIIDNLDE